MRRHVKSYPKTLKKKKEKKTIWFIYFVLYKTLDIRNEQMFKLYINRLSIHLFLYPLVPELTVLVDQVRVHPGQVAS